ncbi:hypothetical protein [Flavobacterium silvaticum]|uniref:C-type lysozyme inhibitor domain-containing protein n=1 Tax=Flavobacterium silvaticum TaxID=1852020 RepID=A0A972FME6_9FLAO|nr:hypothetical protein [Flavobacterium silvaticum]NMH28734.1 hypothetical protein [Flavobacterium silvaticum]
MKNLRLLALLLVIAISSSSFKSNISIAEGGYFDIYIKNNCTKEVEVRVRADGSSSVSKYKAGEKQKVAVKEGYEIYTDGKLFQTLKKSDSGKDINLCK